MLSASRRSWIRLTNGPLDIYVATSSSAIALVQALAAGALFRSAAASSRSAPPPRTESKYAIAIRRRQRLEEAVDVAERGLALTAQNAGYRTRRR